MLKKIKIYLFLVITIFFFSGCFGTLMLAGSAASAASTTQEVDEEYNGNFFDYVGDKYDSFIQYVKESSGEDKNSK